jgi:glycosyltransferase domain-containing protein
MNLSELTIIINSYNRKKEALETLKYWNNFNVQVFFLDGSDEPIKDLNFINNKNLYYYHTGIERITARIKKILPKINTKFCMLSSDDDILLPNALSQCLNELKENSELSSCYGQTFNFYNQNNDIQFRFPYKNLIGYQNASSSKKKRLKKHLSNYIPTIIYSIMRTEHFKCIFNEINYSKFDYYATSEIAATIIINYFGKSKILNNLILIRNKSLQPATKNSILERNRKNQSFFYCFYLPLREKKFKFFSYEISKAIHKHSEIPINKIYKIIRSSVHFYLYSTIKRFFSFKIFNFLTNNLIFFNKLKKKNKIQQMIKIGELERFCLKKKIYLNDQDLKIIKKRIDIFNS